MTFKIPSNSESWRFSEQSAQRQRAPQEQIAEISKDLLSKTINSAEKL